MSIETTGQLEAEDFKTSQSVAAGFVKNKADGEFEYGQAGSAWDLVEAKEIATNLNEGVANRLVFSGLNGEVDEDYMLLFRGRYNDGAGSGGAGVGPAGTTAFREIRLGVNGLTTPPTTSPVQNRILTSGHHFNRGNGLHGVFFRGNLSISLSLTASQPPADFHGRLVFAAAHGAGLNFRRFICTSSVNPVDPLNATTLNNLFDFHIAGSWLDGTTNLTSIEIEFDGQQTVVLPGSSWYLYKIKK